MSQLVTVALRSALSSLSGYAIMINLFRTFRVSNALILTFMDLRSSIEYKFRSSSLLVCDLPHPS